MPNLRDRVKCFTPTVGTGTLAIGAAAPGYRTFASAYAEDRLVSYVIDDGSAWETGIGTFSRSGGTLTRALDASSTGALLNLSGEATVSVAFISRDNVADWPYFEGSAGNPGTTANTFVWLPLNSTVVVDTHGGWNGDGYYTIPEAGVYDCFYNGRMQDGIKQSLGFQIGISNAAADSLTSEFRATYPVLRNAFQHRRVANFAAGTKIAPIMYTDGFSANVGGALVIMRVR